MANVIPSPKMVRYTKKITHLSFFTLTLISCVNYYNENISALICLFLTPILFKIFKTFFLIGVGQQI